MQRRSSARHRPGFILRESLFGIAFLAVPVSSLLSTHPQSDDAPRRMQTSELRHPSGVACDDDHSVSLRCGSDRTVTPPTDDRTTMQPIPQTVTSFGGARLGDSVYTYGGHTGDAHSYCLTNQDRLLRRLNLTTGEWDVLTEGPPLQGLALVAHGNRLFRIGGFTARNADGAEHDLWSTDEVAAFDLPTGKWQTMPSLPEPRSSFDAAVLGDSIYVVGGWSLAGDADTTWHTTAWVMDLSAETPSWKELPTPPFQRRALAVAAFDNRIIRVIGGMQQEGGATRRVDVFDPSTGQWSLGPELVGDDGFAGFGAAAFATGGRLYVSTVNGTLQRLSQDGSEWDVLGQTPTARFFHRLLPLDDSHLLVVGGANMQTGKFDAVEVISVRSTP